MKILLMILALTLSQSVRAGGLRTPFGEVVVRNVKIGQTYSLYKLINLPLRVINTGDETTDLSIETTHLKPEEVKEGYESIPSLDWVRVDRGSFTIAPNREAVTDLIVTIPNDASLLGRRFEADIWSHTTTIRAFQVGVMSRLLIHIDSTPPTEEELKKKFVDEKLADLDFTVLPQDGMVDAIPLGREVSLRKERKILVKMINPTEHALNFRVRSIPVWESVIEVPHGAVQAESMNWLRPEKEIIKVAPNSIADTSFTLTIPDEKRLRGQKIFFVASFEVLEQKIPTRVYFRLVAVTESASAATAK